MGWGRTLLLGDIGNRLDIADTEQDVQRLMRWATENDRLDQAQGERLTALEEENRELKLYVACLGRLLVSRGVLEEADLKAMVAGVEGRPSPSP